MIGLLWAALLLVAGVYGLWLVRLANRVDEAVTDLGVAKRAAASASQATTRMEGRLDASIKRQLRTDATVDGHGELLNRCAGRLDLLVADVEPFVDMRRDIETRIDRACES